MAAKTQISFSEEAQARLHELLNEAERGFNHGSITLSDIVEEAVLTADIDIARVRQKKTNLRKVILGALKSGTRNVDELIEILGQYRGIEPAPRKQRSRKAAAKETEGSST
jgi:outer membrane protein TolC